tara:strand:+ start:10679 stop:11353 length:675 start_codon:yes stop_codon:yes gene_type:complete
MKKDILKKILDYNKKRIAVVHLVGLCNQIDDLVLAGQTTGDKELDNEINGCLKEDRSKLVNISGNDYFIDVYNPPLKLIIVGAVHIAQYLIEFAKKLGFECILIDPREGFASEDRFPDVKVLRNWPDEVLEQLDIDQRTAIVTLTHDPKIDDVALRFALNSSCFYIGSLGSKKTHSARIERLNIDFDHKALDKINAPIGLNIGARSPNEIALSIISQIVSELRT